NVFDIMQGVSINLFIKTKKKRMEGLGKVFHYDIYGKREEKYRTLNSESLKSLLFKEVKYTKPYFFFLPKNDKGRLVYESRFKIDKLFKESSVGFVTANDFLNISFTEKEQTEKISDIINLEE